MIFEIREEKLKLIDNKVAIKGTEEAEATFALLPIESLPDVIEEFQIDVENIDEVVKWSLSNVDHHNNFDILHIDLVKLQHLVTKRHKIIAYKTDSKLYFFADESIIKELEVFFQEERHPRYNLDKLLFLLFKKIGSDYSEMLNTLEEKLTKMEEDMLQFKELNYLKSLMLIRHSLIDFNKYIDITHDLIEDMLLDENSLISDEGSVEFSAVMRKFERLASRVLVLKDLISQVRGTYQAQEDLKLNQIMKIFTVITSIFLPLTVITSWYGMNLKMPEFQLEYGYPLVISGILVVVLSTIALFKKKKWF